MKKEKKYIVIDSDGAGQVITQKELDVWTQDGSIAEGDFVFEIAREFHVLPAVRLVAKK